MPILEAPVPRGHLVKGHLTLTHRVDGLIAKEPVLRRSLPLLRVASKPALPGRKGDGISYKTQEKASSRNTHRISREAVEGFHVKECPKWLSLQQIEPSPVGGNRKR